MTSIYRTPAGREAVAAWCHERFDRWAVAHERETTVAHGTPTHVVAAGRGEYTVLLVPGTNFGAAAYLPLATALAAHCRVVVADLPGQPGLSSGERIPRAGRLDWYGRWLTALIEKTARGPVTVLGHSLGAAIALAADSPLVRNQVLVSPGGLTRLRITPAILAASTNWVLRRTPTASARLLRLMHGPAHAPRPELVEWMTLVARHVRSTADPGEAAVAGREVPRAVVVGESDVFLPSRKLAPAVRRTLGVELQVLPSAGHLVVEENPEHLAELVTGAQESGT
ncbi:alpha/beta fold hydrolase [Prauserella endophytica]|uniref:Alpha/beta hydrolase n=1 Tax=Prauserella endophytica TaxID=1592324 RepID=A0ABY2SAT0_9PSEU|nr:alpha/beta hydrolase [Prauserella endophytica]TKG72942.1 alpha/beta hydrolase [Prauserella endophytica]